MIDRETRLCPYWFEADGTCSNPDCRLDTDGCQYEPAPPWLWVALIAAMVVTVATIALITAWLHGWRP